MTFKGSEATCGHIFLYEVANTYSERGELEDLEAKIEKIASVVAEMLDQMEDASAREILRKHCRLHSEVNK